MSLAHLLLPASRLIEMPDDLDEVVRIADDEEPAAAGGMRAASIDAIWRAVLRWYRSGTQPLITLCLRRRGHVLLHRSIGHASGHGPGASGVPVVGEPDTPVTLFSASKMVTAILIHALAERGAIDLDAPIHEYLPAFSSNGKQRVTVRDLLAHRGGIPQMPANLEPHDLFDFDTVVERLCAAPKVASHAGRQAYHAVTGGFILGAIATAVTGRDLRELLDELLVQPLGLATFNYGIDARRAAEVAINYATGPRQVAPLAAMSRRALGADWADVVDVSNQPEFLAATIPAANVVATAGDTARFMQMLLDEGRGDHGRVLQAATVRGAVAPAGGTSLDRMLLVPMRYSAGLMLGNSPVGLYGPMCRNAYGHLGLINIFCWADPDRELAVALLSTGKSLYGTHLVALTALLNSIGWRTLA